MGKPYAEVIGDPIAHSKSPLIHNFWLGKLGIDAEYRACHVRPDELADYFALRRGDAAWRGCNVTMPHKEAACGVVDGFKFDLPESAVNCVYPQARSLIGANTDGHGVQEALSRPFAPGVDSNRQYCVIGAGGAARSAVAFLDVVCAHRYTSIVRDINKGRAFWEEWDAPQRIVGFEDACKAIAGSHGLINASPLGMNGFAEIPSSVIESLEKMDRDGFVFDMVYAPLDTMLLTAARARGLVAIDGLHMLMGQAAEAFRLIFDQTAPRQHDAELRTLLTV